MRFTIMCGDRRAFDAATYDEAHTKIRDHFIARMKACGFRPTFNYEVVDNHDIIIAEAA